MTKSNLTQTRPATSTPDLVVGELPATALADLVLPVDELLSARFVPARLLDDHVIPILAVRLRAAIGAAEEGIARYLEC